MKASYNIFVSLAFMTFVLVIFCLPGNSQNFPEWTEPLAVTDSVTDNLNPNLKMAFRQDFHRMMFMVWEKVLDDQTTALYYRDILSPDDPQILMYAAGVRYTRPKITGAPITHFMPPQDTLLYIFFESDQNGNSDIYYVKYLQGGVILGPYPFAVTAAEETNLAVNLDGPGDKSDSDRDLVKCFAWTRDGQLMTRYLEIVSSQLHFTEPELVDQGPCASPLMYGNYKVFWIRESGQGSFLYYSVRESSPLSEWSEPVLLFDEGDCSHLRGDKLREQVVSWTALTDSAWHIWVAPPDNPVPYSFDVSQDTPFAHAVGSYGTISDASIAESGPRMIAFPYEEAGNQEIFMNEDPWIPSFMNFSFSGTENRNPDFFHGEDIEATNFYYDYLVWESFRNGHWQIFASKTVTPLVGIEEGPDLNNVLRINPNPFNDKMTIRFYLASGSNVDIEVLNPWGQQIRLLSTGYRENGKQSVLWDGRDDSANSVPPGIYFIRANIGDKSYTVKVLKGL